jgi:alanyl-tRNA synthetase
MNVTETIRTFLEFYRDRGHKVLPGSSLVPPRGDPVLFTTAGMHPLTQYLEGRPHSQGRRLVGVQRCLRTTDLDETGDDRHLTVFQMLGQPSVHGCDVFQPWTTALTGLWQPDQRSMRLLTDHLRSSIVIIGDGVTPSNTGRGYVLRRLLRRALTVLWRPGGTRTLDELPTSLVEQTLRQFGQHEDSGLVREVLRGEERRFAGLLTRGRKVLAQLGPDRPLTEADLRYLHQTHGLPPELVTELLD